MQEYWKKNPKNIKTQEILFADCPQSGIKVSFLLQHTSLHYPTPALFQRFVHPLEGDDYFVQEKETDLVLEERSNRQETCTYQVAHGNYSNGPCAHSVLALKSCDLQCFQIPGKKMLWDVPRLLLPATHHSPIGRDQHSLNKGKTEHTLRENPTPYITNEVSWGPPDSLREVSSKWLICKKGHHWLKAWHHWCICICSSDSE